MLHLHPVDPIDAINEENQDGNETDLDPRQLARQHNGNPPSRLTFIPYWSFATIGLSEMKVKSFRLQVKGSGRISSMNMIISATSMKNT